MLCLAINIFIVILYTCGDGTVIDTTMRKKRREAEYDLFHSIRSDFMLAQQKESIK